MLIIELRDLETLYPTLSSDEKGSDNSDQTGETDPLVSEGERSEGAEGQCKISSSPTPTPDNGSALSSEIPVSEINENAEDSKDAPRGEEALGSSSLSDTGDSASEGDLEAQGAARALLLAKAKVSAENSLSPA